MASDLEQAIGDKFHKKLTAVLFLLSVVQYLQIIRLADNTF